MAEYVSDPYYQQYEAVFREWKAGGFRINPTLAARIRDSLGNLFIPRHIVGEQRKRNLLEIQIILWEKSIWNAAGRGCEDLEGSIRPPIPAQDLQLWLLSEPTEYQGVRAKAGRVMMGEFVLFHRNGKPDYRSLLTTNGDDLMFSREDLVAAPGEPLAATDCETVSRALFLELDYIDFRDEALPRATRRRYEREGLPLPAVKTVTLRRAPRREQDADDESGFDYSCQWVVSGHWRKQFYPSRKEHAPKYIAPYAKGDPSKPFRPGRDTVYVAKR